jgi:NAD(P)-dependent dehydrogenase (short-subunit alcohol dehydrogenase family)
VTAVAGALRGRVALVTGGAGGIGQAVARALAAEGVRVALAGRDEEALRAVRAGAEAPLVVPLDVRDAAAWDRAVSAVITTFGRLDVLVHNAGILEVGPLATRTEDGLRAIVDTNLTGAMLGTRAALPVLRASRGTVVHVASLGGIVPMPFEACYAATKAGLRHLSLSLRAELAHEGVTVSVVTPDSVETPQLAGELRHDEAALSFANPALPPDAVGAAVVRALRTGAAEVLVPGGGGLLARIVATFPRLWDWIVPWLRRTGARRMARLRSGEVPPPAGPG